MKYIIILLALFFNGCAIYIIKCDCPPKEVIKESYLYWDYKPEPYKPILPYMQDSTWFYDFEPPQGL